jgi:hypothetical protein
LLAAELGRIYVPWVEFAPEYIDLPFGLERVESEEEAGEEGEEVKEEEREWPMLEVVETEAFCLESRTERIRAAELVLYMIVNLEES